MKPKFKATKRGLVITDPIERKRYPLETGGPVTPSAGDEDRIPYPVDSTAAITTDRVTLPENPVIYVRSPDGTLHSEVNPGDDITYPEKEYIIDLSGPLKVYVYVNSVIRVRVGRERAELVLEDPTQMTIGARSFHRRPAETVSTTADPTDIMRAVSTFGSSLKTTTQERAYPTLRGHPPALEVTDEMSIPDNLDRPQTGVKIEVPATLRHVFVVAPLAYYLGANVVPGSTPRLVTKNRSHSLNREPGFEATVERTLRQVFFLDCIVQTEGETPSALYERRSIEPLLEFDIGKVYDQTLDEQLETYLELPFETIEPNIPTWYSEVYLEPTANHIEFLPFIAGDLLSVKTTDGANDPTQVTQEVKLAGTATRMNADTDDSHSECSINVDDTDCYPSNPVVRQHWKTSDGSDVISAKPLSAFDNGITRSPRDGPLAIEVVCNDPSMSDEFVTAYSTYRGGSDIPFDVTVHHDLSKSNLRDVLVEETDVLHYIGHIDTEGFRCSDGTLDAADLASVGPKTFFLNACRSYEQGLNLIEAGSIGGIVTSTEIQNETAVAAGNTVADLLNAGVPLYAALRLLQQDTGDENQYQLLGDGSIAMSHLEVTAPTSISISKQKTGYKVRVISYVNTSYKPGSVYTPYITTADSYHLVPGEATFNNVSKPDLVEFLNKKRCPVLFEDELCWSTEIKTSEL